MLTSWKLLPCLLKQLSKTREKLKEWEIKCQNPIYICISLCSKICLFRMKKCWCQQNSRDVSRDLYIFWIFLCLGITVQRYVWHILGRGGNKKSPHPFAAQKKTILNRVNGWRVLNIFVKIAISRVLNLPLNRFAEKLKV